MKPYSCHPIIILALLTVLGCSPQEQAQEAPPPEIPVIVTQAQAVNLPIEFVGQVYGSKDIAIRARVEGFLEGIHFEEGSEVKAGDLLYVLESQPYDADVAAKMSMVAEAKTMLAKAASDLNRIRPLAKRNAVSQSDLDAAIAQYEAAKSSVEAAQAVLKASKIMLSYTKIYSPINGIIGKTRANVGDFVGRGPNTVVLNVVSNTDPIHVEFFLTENQYLELARRYEALQGDADSALEAPNRHKAPLSLILADGSLFSDQGKFVFIDRGIDPTTGSILVQTSFPNPQKLVRPGQFARIRTIMESIDDGILIPQRCVMEQQGRYRVYVVAGGKVEERQVTPGPTQGRYWLIRDGLKPGEQIVFEGLQKVRDGMTVNPVVQDVTPNTTEEK
jgi:membrane fusion protein (multidrug efflux system)